MAIETMVTEVATWVLDMGVVTGVIMAMGVDTGVIKSTGVDTGVIMATGVAITKTVGESTMVVVEAAVETAVN
jgi:hypothetical protein